MKDNTVTIRKYLPNDASNLVKLFSDLGYPSDTESIYNRLHFILQKPDYYAFVLIKENQIIGFSGLCKMDMFEADQSYIRILAFVIDSDYRGKKYGTKFLTEIEKIAISINAPIVTLNSGNRNERNIAHEFYKQKGYTIKSSGFIKSLNT